MEDEKSSEMIRLALMNGIAYIWNAKDWMKLRELRILGNFIGSLAALPRQYRIEGFPLALLKEEVTLLLEKEFAVISLISNISGPPDADVQKKSHDYFEKLFSEQTELLTNNRKQEIESKIDTILEGKRAKRGHSKVNLDRESVLQEEFNKLQPIKKSALAIHICTGDPWLEDKDFEFCSWEYPKDEKENLHYVVFKDLWERGYYITPGGKFGGDYLVYPADPLKFHAFFIVICVEKEKVTRINEIVSYGRLGQSVRKTVALAFLNESNEVCYQSIQWSGF